MNGAETLMPAQQRKTPVSTVSLWTTVRDDLNRLTLDMSVKVGRKVSVSAVVAAMLTVIDNHKAELVTALTNPRKEGSTDS